MFDAARFHLAAVDQLKQVNRRAVVVFVPAQAAVKVRKRAPPKQPDVAVANAVAYGVFVAKRRATNHIAPKVSLVRVVNQVDGVLEQVCEREGSGVAPALYYMPPLRAAKFDATVRL